MQRILLTLSAFCLMTLLHGQVIYVKAGATGTGASWADAQGCLQTAIQNAQAGTAIWVATGVYTPSTEGIRESSFSLPEGVRLFGGFQGTEEKLEQRDPATFITVLSGEIGDQSTNEDNSYTLVYFNKVSKATVLDGFVLTAAAANGIVDGADLSTCGGAIFINSVDGQSSPTITNCVFYGNSAREGAAIYIHTERGEASPLISGCEFNSNQSDFNGGAIFNDGNYGSCTPTISNCVFTSNESLYGAAILNRGLSGTCKPVIKDCHFADNLAIIAGSAIYNDTEGRGGVDPIMAGNYYDDSNVTATGDKVVDGAFQFNNTQSTTPATTVRKSGVRTPTTTTTSTVAY